ncbi:MAG: hypothetical protein ACRD8K_04990 [Nitrososphaeraceae archaeon]
MVLFEKYGVDMVISSHDQYYERTYPITFTDDDEDRLIVLDNNQSIYKNPKWHNILNSRNSR